MKAVFSWRCKCGVRVKVVGETDSDNPTAKTTVICPSCADEQIIGASKVLSVTKDEDEIVSRGW
jgi:hypothetical protein